MDIYGFMKMRGCTNFKERTVADRAQVRQDAAGVRTAGSGERGLAGIIAGEEEEVLELGGTEVEPREPVVPLQVEVRSRSLTVRPRAWP